MPAEPHPAPSTPATDLVLSYCFPPYVDTAAIVAAKRVRAMGRPVDVIQNQMAPERAVDEGLASIADHLVVRRNAIDSATYFSAWKSIVRWCELGLQQALEWDREGPGYERVYSRAHFSASHILAARFALLRPGVRWTAEFSDPLSHDVRGEVRHAPATDDALLQVLEAGVRRAGFEPPTNRNVYEWAEVVAFALADEVLFTNAHQRDLMVDAVPDPALRERILRVSTVSPHPTLEPTFYQMGDPAYELDPGRRHIAYFGNFYATRGMGTVLDALEVLPQEQRDRLRLHVFAGRAEELVSQVARRGLQDVVRAGPFVSFLDFLALCRRMDVLLVNDALTSGMLPANPFLPSKWSDYKGSGTPVWGIVERGSILDGQDLTYRSLVGYPSAAVQVLAQIANS
ncbi:glycosyltransferase family 4 protein [Ornithinimicrobium pratense]|uniref:Glycosyltransferase family 4 protein n=1 Tax=Ornithinimicrobium pratense TaxID=2593973 RepID=A0A5J6V8B8_9MICO|nr:glycosyltransferase family 4 protein [Ornithinimicrobium pratense]QFG70028.1 glycosyltransferase family 4 protein [Ornithinimicrobium pratense]